ncbi:uncharacterized protein [Miscanthus floridulus]|uniref:uncharacterized protein n=1 Tax=Miscanthus floridulus TaxID=154761 RepID=UPI00345AB198
MQPASLAELSSHPAAYQYAPCFLRPARIDRPAPVGAAAPALARLIASCSPSAAALGAGCPCPRRIASSLPSATAAQLGTWIWQQFAPLSSSSVPSLLPQIYCRQHQLQANREIMVLKHQQMCLCLAWSMSVASSLCW